MTIDTIGTLHKMRTIHADTVQYALVLDGIEVSLNELLGKHLTLSFQHRIFCVVCGRETKKAFGQGFCYPCFMNAPENAECIIRPELCRGHLGEGRDPEWEKNHHVQPHYVYLALSSDVKVGVTRLTQVPTRWIDQGASEAILFAKVPYRQLAGAIEVDLKKYLPDKTHWQKMLKNQVAQDVDLRERKSAASVLLDESLREYVCPDDTLTVMNYPVLRYPQKIVSLNLLKTPEVGGVLEGIKGQYLLFAGGGVINLRNHSGFQVRLTA